MSRQCILFSKRSTAHKNMGIKKAANFEQVIAKGMESFLKETDRRIMMALEYMGEQCLIEARTNKGYTDQTGNLAASVGYVILKNGRVAKQSGFQGKINDSERRGPAKGRELAFSLATQYSGDYSLIVVAGMNYAAYVEVKGRNVLTSAELLAERELPVLLTKLNLV